MTTTQESRYSFYVDFPLGNGRTATISAHGDVLQEIITAARDLFKQVNGMAAIEPSQPETPEDRTPPIEECPEHHRAVKGRWGLYCTAKVDEGYCKWRPESQASKQ